MKAKHAAAKPDPHQLAQSTLYFERLLELKDEQLAMKTKLSAAAAAKPDQNQLAQKRLIQGLTRERDEWRALSERPGGPARELERLRRENKAQALWLEAYALALMQAGRVSRAEAEASARAQVAKIGHASARALLERTAHTTRGAPRPSSSAGPAHRPTTADRASTAARLAHAEAVGEGQRLRHQLRAEVERREAAIDAWSDALAEQHARTAQCREDEAETRERAIELRLQREEAAQVRADLRESELEKAVLRREVCALQEKLMAYFASATLS
jgi:hypothetical protein